MKDKIGYQIGLEKHLPLGEGGMINLIMSALNWQEFQGPSIIFVDEPFYRFIVRTGIEDIYHDIIPLPEGADMDMAMEYVKNMFPVEIFAVPNVQKEKMTREDINMYILSLPEQIRDSWEQLLLNEEMILSLEQPDRN